MVGFMLRRIALILACAVAGFAQDFTLDHLFTRPYVWGTSPSQVAWAKHAHIVCFLWNAQGQMFRDLYAYNADTKTLKRLTDLESLKDPINDGEAERDPHRQDYLAPRAGLAGYDLSEDGNEAVFSYRGDLFIAPTNGSAVRRLTKTKASEMNPQFSPDASKIAYSQGGQIYVLSLNGGMLEQRTDLKTPAVLTSFHWSPDGKLLSYGVAPNAGRMLPLPIYSGQFVTASPIPRSVAGDAPVAAQWYVTEASGDAPARLLETGKGIGRRGAQWSPDSKYLLLAEQSANYKSQDVRVVNVNTGKSKIVFHQEDNRWVEVSDLGWDQTGQHLWFTSDQSGYQHLYSLSPSGDALKQLTKGEWEVHNDPFSHTPQWIGDWIYYSSTQDSTAERQFYRVKADGGSAPERLSNGQGLHIGWVSEDGQLRVMMHADMKNPFDLFVDARQITKSPLAAFYQMPWAETRFVHYPSSKDGKTVSARLLLPRGYNPDDPNANSKPAIVYIHGAGYATSVLQQWGSYQELRFVFNNYLASRGFVVLEMDYRGSTNYGRDWRSGVYLNLGGPDLEDVLGGVEYLRSLKNIDMNRVGIWGWSYGGFMTAMAMFKSPAAFKAGAAFSGVYDWANYNADYTGERLTPPAENPEAYQRSSPIHFSDRLQNHLLILHGIADDNVLFQEAVQLAEKLVHEGKPFEEAFYPEENHAYVRDETLKDAFGRTARFFDRYLNDAK
jgi:dipeptidyl aminopeptidase/acylaminoacyl peptidase